MPNRCDTVAWEPCLNKYGIQDWKLHSQFSQRMRCNVTRTTTPTLVVCLWGVSILEIKQGRILIQILYFLPRQRLVRGAHPRSDGDRPMFLGRLSRSGPAGLENMRAEVRKDST